MSSRDIAHTFVTGGSRVSSRIGRVAAQQASAKSSTGWRRQSTPAVHRPDQSTSTDGRFAQINEVCVQPRTQTQAIAGRAGRHLRGIRAS